MVMVVLLSVLIIMYAITFWRRLITQNGRFVNEVPNVIVQAVIAPVTVTSPTLSVLPGVIVGVPHDDAAGAGDACPSIQCPWASRRPVSAPAVMKFVMLAAGCPIPVVASPRKA